MAETVTQYLKMDTKYMKWTISAILVVVLLLQPMCGEKDPQNNPEHTDTDSLLFTPGGRRRTTPLFSEDMLDSIAELQEAVSDSTSDPKNLEKLRQYCLDSITDSYLVVGKGTPNPEHPPSAHAVGRRRAAVYSAERWALYHKAWSSGKAIQFGDDIFGKVMYSKVLTEKAGSETLSVLLQVPIGSVVLQKPAPN